MAFLSEHREIVRMRAREVKAFEVSTLAHRCSFHGLLEHEINEYREIAPKHMLEELQEVRRLLTDASRSLSGRGRGDEEGLCRCCSACWLVLVQVMTQLHDELLEEDGAFAEEQQGLPTDDGRKDGQQHGRTTTAIMT